MSIDSPTPLLVGIGGLGHLGLLFSNALGAETFALSHSDSKLADAEKLGVDHDHFIITKDLKATAKQWARSFDLLICTSFQEDLPVSYNYFPFRSLDLFLTCPHVE